MEPKTEGPKIKIKKQLSPRETIHFNDQKFLETKRKEILLNRKKSEEILKRFKYNPTLAKADSRNNLPLIIIPNNSNNEKSSAKSNNSKSIYTGVISRNISKTIVPLKVSKEENIHLQKRKSTYNDTMTGKLGTSQSEKFTPNRSQAITPTPSQLAMKAQINFDIKKKIVKKDKLLDEIKGAINSPNFSRFQQLVTKSEFKIRPDRNWEKAEVFLKYINELNNLGKNMIEKELTPLENLENRYNREHPGEDAQIKLDNKALVEHLWKNYFSLSEYQNFFLDHLKGKVSTLTYADMLKEFRIISQICFYKGKVNYGLIKYGILDKY